MRVMNVLLAGGACLALAACSNNASHNATDVSGGAAVTNGAPTEDPGPVRDDHSKLCQAIDAGFLDGVSGPGYAWATPKLTPPAGAADWSCVSSNAGQNNPKSLFATVTLTPCAQWQTSFAAVKKSSAFHQLGVGDEGGYDDPRLVDLRVGTECFAIASSIMSGGSPDAATAGKVSLAAADRLARTLMTPSAPPSSPASSPSPSAPAGGASK